MTACFTGHRPNKLGGYKTPNKIYNVIKNILDLSVDRAISLGYDTFISGGALGVDQWALDVLFGKRCRVIIARPFPSQDCRWPLESQKIYREMILKADEVVDVCEDPYESWKMQKRNEWMVDKSNLVIAVWDGSNGGTGNCVKYAKALNKEIWNVNFKKLI